MYPLLVECYFAPYGKEPIGVSFFLIGNDVLSVYVGENYYSYQKLYEMT